MRKYRMVVLVLALAVTAGLMLGAYAADPPAKPAPVAEKAAPAKPAAAAKPKIEVKCVVSGKLESKMVPNKKTGKEDKGFFVTVATAKGADGKPLDALKGKTFRVGGKKDVKLADFVCKEVTIDGTLINNKRIVPDSIK
jgi:hypothetical protein